MPQQPAFGKLISGAEFVCSLSSCLRSPILDTRKGENRNLQNSFFLSVFGLLQNKINAEIVLVKSAAF